MIGPYVKSSIANALETYKMPGLAQKIFGTLTPSDRKWLKEYLGDMAAPNMHRNFYHSALGHGLLLAPVQGLAGGLITKGLGMDFMDGAIAGVGLSPLTAGAFGVTNKRAKTLPTIIY